jgi:hypothetical protein
LGGNIPFVINESFREQFAVSKMSSSKSNLADIARHDRQSRESPLSAMIRVAISPAPRERSAIHLPLAK